MARLPSEFRKSTDFNISFDFFDLADGTGVKTMYAGQTNSNNVIGGVILGTQFYSSKVMYSSSANYNTTFSKKIELDFDTNINQPITLKGRTIINFSGGIQCTHGAGGEYTLSPNVIIRKVDSNDNVTDILEVSGALLTDKDLLNTNYYYIYDAITGDIPRTTFNKGDKIRLTCELWGKTSASGVSTTSFIGTDPQNRQATNEDELTFASTDRSDTVWLMPIEIDV